MASNTKIIELYGLPGCGKTTLRQYALENNSIVEFCLMTNISNEYKKKSIIKKIIYFPYKSFFYIVLLFICLGYKKGDSRFWKGIILISIIYSYRHEYSNKDCYIVVDHGIVQNIISLSYTRGFNLSDYSIKVVGWLLRSLSIDYLLNCEVTPEVSAKRIRMRNRTNSGRIDGIQDEHKILDILRNENNLIDFLNMEFLREGLKGCSKLNMELEPQILFNEICSLINK